MTSTSQELARALDCSPSQPAGRSHVRPTVALADNSPDAEGLTPGRGRPPNSDGRAASPTHPGGTQPMTPPRQCARLYWPGQRRQRQCENRLDSAANPEALYCSARCKRATTKQAATPPKAKAKRPPIMPTVTPEVDPASFGYGPHNRPPWTLGQVTERLLNRFAHRTPERLAAYLAYIAEAEERAAMRAEGVAYDYINAEGVRQLWHPDAVATTGETIDALLAAKAKTPPILSPDLPAAHGYIARKHYGPSKHYGDKAKSEDGGTVRPTRRSHR